MMIARRELLTGLAALTLGCGKDGGRCAHCGMKLDAKSPFGAELKVGGKTLEFDTPRCALSEWKAQGGAVRVQEFYSRAMVDGSTVRFVKGSDVLGPMGPELVPVEPARVAKFEADHGGTADFALTQLDDAALTP